MSQFVANPFPAIASFIADPILGLCDVRPTPRAAPEGGRPPPTAFSTSATNSTNTTNSTTMPPTATTGGGIFGVVGSMIGNAAIATTSLSRSAACLVLQLVRTILPPFAGTIDGLCSARGSSAARIPFVPPLPSLPALDPQFLASPLGKHFCDHLQSGVTAWKQWLSISYTYVYRVFGSAFFNQRMGIEFRRNYANNRPTLTTTYFTRRAGGGECVATAQQSTQQNVVSANSLRA